MPKECTYISTCFVVERERLRSWAISVGLDQYTNEESVNASIRNTRLPLLAILTEMRTLITDFFKLNAKYSEINITAIHKEGFVTISGERLAEAMESVEPPLEPLDQGKKLSFLKRRKEAIKDLGTDIHTVVTHPKRLLWVVFDQKKAEILIKRLNYLNRYLEGLIDEHQMGLLMETMQKSYMELVQMHNDVTVLSSLAQAMNLNLIGYSQAATTSTGPGPFPDAVTPLQKKDRESRAMLSALVKFKELKISERRTPANIHPKQVNPRHVTRGRTDGKYTSTEGKVITVWVEWKAFEVDSPEEGKPEPEPEILPRIEELAGLLTSEKPREFCVPPCLGFFKIQEAYKEAGNFGFVFTAPDNAPKGSRLHTLLTSLREDSKPSLTDRCALARKLATCILYLHSVNWLHKELRSSNVVCFSQERDPSFHDPYIMGFEYSRPAGDGQSTERVRYVPEWEIYRHPDYQGLLPSGARKTFDIYSLGIILIEIALWKQIKDVFPSEVPPHLEREGERANNPPEAEVEDDEGSVDEGQAEEGGKLGRGEEEYADAVEANEPELGGIQKAILDSESAVSREIRSAVGDKYYEAVETCIGGGISFEIDRQDQETNTDTAVKLQQLFETLVVDRLKGVIL
jgi:hypothetical protein